MNPMKKSLIFTSILISFTQLVHADTDNQLFQNLDNSVGVGYSFNSMHAYNLDNSISNTTTNSNNLALHLERLFDNNIWMAVDGSFAFKASQTGENTGFSKNTQNFGFPASISGKGGYSFNWQNIGLQVIPYAQLGRELNYNGMAVFNDTFEKSYLNQFAFGGRIEYAFNPAASIYFDQSIGYLQDPNQGELNQSSNNFTSLFGIKYNATNYFQIAAQGMISQINLTNPNVISYDPNLYQYANTSQTTYGGMLLFSYLYNNDQLMNSTVNSLTPAKSHQYLTTNFDNSYSIGLGLVNSSSYYSAGNNPPINSTLSYLNFNVTHEFDSAFWSQLNAQLVNSISQDNIPAGRVNSVTPTYIGFPGSVISNNGYAFHSGDHLTVIPYGNAGIVMNIASYNLRENTGINSAISRDMFIQLGGGARVEYAIDNFWQIYADQLFAGMKDRSPLNVNTWRSTSSIGAVINPYSLLQVGVKGIYDTINPIGNTYNSQSNLYVPANQNSLGMQFDIGLRY